MVREFEGQVLRVEDVNGRLVVSLLLPFRDLGVFHENMTPEKRKEAKGVQEENRLYNIELIKLHLGYVVLKQPDVSVGAVDETV